MHAGVFMYHCSIFWPELLTSETAREMVQRLRALAVLPEDPSLVPRIHVSPLTAACHPSSSAANELFWPP